MQKRLEHAETVPQRKKRHRKAANVGPTRTLLYLLTRAASARPSLFLRSLASISPCPGSVLVLVSVLIPFSSLPTVQPLPPFDRDVAHLDIPKEEGKRDPLIRSYDN